MTFLTVKHFRLGGVQMKFNTIGQGHLAGITADGKAASGEIQQ